MFWTRTFKAHHLPLCWVYPTVHRPVPWTSRDGAPYRLVCMAINSISRGQVFASKKNIIRLISPSELADRIKRGFETFRISGHFRWIWGVLLHHGRIHASIGKASTRDKLQLWCSQDTFCGYLKHKYTDPLPTVENDGFSESLWFLAIIPMAGVKAWYRSTFHQPFPICLDLQRVTILANDFRAGPGRLHSHMKH